MNTNYPTIEFDTGRGACHRCDGTGCYCCGGTGETRGELELSWLRCRCGWQTNGREWDASNRATCPQCDFALDEAIDDAREYEMALIGDDEPDADYYLSRMDDEGI